MSRHLRSPLAAVAQSIDTLTRVSPHLINATSQLGRTESKMLADIQGSGELGGRETILAAKRQIGTIRKLLDQWEQQTDLVLELLPQRHGHLTAHPGGKPTNSPLGQSSPDPDPAAA